MTARPDGMTTGPETRLAIPTVAGLAEVQSLLRTEPDVPNTIALPDFTKLPVSQEYDTFVRRPSGAIEQDFGHATWFMLVSSRIDSGKSWQLGTYLAHALEARGALWMDTPDGADIALQERFVVATGAIQKTGMVVQKVGQISEKLTIALPRLFKARQAGQTALFVLPEANVPDISPEMAMKYAQAGIEIHGVATVAQALQLLGVEAAAASAQSWKGSPWPGLAAYTAAQRRVFFGRDRARKAAMEQMLQAEARSFNGLRRPFLLVHGPSGVGKSSFARAGMQGDIIERVKTGMPWASLTVTFSGIADRPDQHIAQAIVAEILSDAADTASTATDITNNPEQTGALLDSAGQGRLFLILDQFEQALVGLASDQAEVLGHFLDRLCSTGRVWILATIRSGQLEWVYRVPSLSALAVDARQFRLEGPDRDAISKIITGPADAAGITFDQMPDGISLVQTLVTEASRSTDSLPLLQLALSRLFGYAIDGKIGYPQYEAMGGLAGAATTSADEAVAKLRAEDISDASIDRLLAELVRIDPETGDVLARTISLPTPHDTDADPARVRIARHMTDTRLLVELDEGDGPHLRLAHEALFLLWPRLKDLTGKIRAEILLRDEIEAEALRWNRAGRGADLLRRTEARVSVAKDLRDGGLLPLSADAKTFIARSISAMKRDWWGRMLVGRILPVMIAVVAIVFAVYVLSLNQKAVTAEKAALALKEKADDATKNAKDRLALAQTNESLWFASLARRESLEGRNVTAMSRILDALPESLITPDRPLVPEAFAEFQRLAHHDLNSISLKEAHETSISSIAWSRDGTLVISGSFDETIAVWDRPTGLELLRISCHCDFVNSVDISPDGRQIVSSSDDGTLRLWDRTSGEAIRILTKAETGGMRDAQYAPGGGRILARDDNGSVYLFDATSLELIRKSPSVFLVPIKASFSGDGSMFMMGSQGGWLQVYQSADGAEIADLSHPLNGVRSATFLQGNVLAAIGYMDGTIRLWDIAAKKIRREMTGHDGPVTQLVQSPDGTQIISASDDGKALLWDLKTDTAPIRLVGQKGRINGTVFIGNGDVVATASSDGFVRLYEARSGTLIEVVEADENNLISALSAQPGGSGVVAGSGGGTLWIGDARRRGLRRLLEQFGEPDVVFGPAAEGDRIYAAEIQPSRNVTKSAIWSATTRQRSDLPSSVAVDMLGASFQASGDVFATVGMTGDTLLWRQSDGAFLRLLSQSSWLSLLVPVFSPDGRKILTSAEGAVQISPIKEGDAPIKTLPLDGAATAGAWSHDGRKLVTGTSIGWLAVWDRKGDSWIQTSARKIEKSGTFTRIDEIALAQDASSLLALTDANEVWHWNASNKVSNEAWRWIVGPGPGSTPTRFGPEVSVHGMALSPDGRQVALGLDRDVVILSLQSGAELHRLVGHEGPVRWLDFSPEADFLITAAFDGTARIWDIKTGLPVYVLGTPGRGKTATFGVHKDGVTLVSGDGMIVRVAYDELVNPATQLEYQRLLFANGGDVSGTGAAPIGTDTDEVSDCDRLTAHPFDPQARATGIRFDHIDGSAAVKACQRALTDDPENPRYLFQLGRGHLASGDKAAAQEAYRAASAAGYGIAYYMLGIDEPDPVQKAVLLESAVSHGALVASGDLGELLWQGTVQPAGRNRALLVWQAGISGGDPYSASQLGRVASLGLMGGRDPEAALGHFLLAARLWQHAGYDGKTEMANAANLARSLPPEVAVRIMHEIAAQP